MGDFNINLIHDDAPTRKFLTCLSTFALYPLINVPTRINPNSSTLIDNIVTNVVDSKFESGVLYADVSDHLPIFCVRKKIIVPNNPSNPIINNIREYSDQNIKSLINDLIQETWTDVYEEKTDANAAYNIFYDKFKRNYDKNVPVIHKHSKRKNNRRPWITKGIIKSIHKKNTLFKKHVRNPNDAALHNTFKRYRNRLNSIIRLSRKTFYAQKLYTASNNVKQTWNILKMYLERKQITFFQKT